MTSTMVDADWRPDMLLLGHPDCDYIDSDILGHGILLKGHWPRIQPAIELAEALLRFHSNPWEPSPDPYGYPPRLDSGWFRKIPCSPLVCGDHGWHLYKADSTQPSTGSFEAFLVEWRFDDDPTSRSYRSRRG